MIDGPLPTGHEHAFGRDLAVGQTAAKRCEAPQAIPALTGAAHVFGGFLLRDSARLAEKARGRSVAPFRRILPSFRAAAITYEVLDRAASLWADGQGQGLGTDDADLIIAATAMLHGLPLVTANTRHFAWIADLPLVIGDNRNCRGRYKCKPPKPRPGNRRRGWRE